MNSPYVVSASGWSVLLFIFLLPVETSGQNLQKMNIERQESGAGIPVFTEHPDKAGIIIESTVSGLRFSSNMRGIVEVREHASGQYVLIIEPFTQIIRIDAENFVQERFRVGNPQPRDVLYFSVNVEAQSSDLISVVFNVSPEDATLFLNGQQAETNKTIRLPAEGYEVRIQREGYRSINEIVNVTADNILFSYEMEEIELVPVNISANVPGASVIIDGVQEGVIDQSGNFGIFKFPGAYALSLRADGYANINQTLEVIEVGNNEFSFEMGTSSSGLSLTIEPADADILINGLPFSSQDGAKLQPGNYQVEISKTGYEDFAEEVVIQPNELTRLQVILEKKVANLRLQVSPQNARVFLNRKEYEGIDNIELSPGRYRLEIEQEGYKSFSETLELSRGGDVERNIVLEPETGSLQFSVIPGSANVRLIDEKGEAIEKWTGLKIIRDLPIGIYTLEMQADNHRSEQHEIRIITNERLEVSLQLEESRPGLKLSSGAECGTEIRDVEGNTYQTVQIGEQCWMAENLRSGTYRDGSGIANIEKDEEWYRRRQGAWAAYDNSTRNIEAYGKLYNWYAVNDERGICPANWKVPSDADWRQLEMHLGMSWQQANETDSRGDENNIGGRLKAVSDLWRGDNAGVTNETAFSARPGGLRNALDGKFFGLRNTGNWWSTSDPGRETAWRRRLNNNDNMIFRDTVPYKQYGFSVRCIAD